MYILELFRLNYNMNVTPKHNFNVSMYRSPPEGTEDLTNLVNMALERLKLYAFFENHKSASLEELQAHVKESPLIVLLQKESPNMQTVRTMDYLSHWILRIAYKDMPEYYIKYELEWFKIRFKLMEDQDQLSFLKENNFTFTHVTEDEKVKLNLDSNVTFKIKCFEVPTLLRLRRYHLHDSYIHIPAREIVHWLLYKLGNQLRASLLYTKKSRLTLLQDEQLQTLLSFLKLVKPTYKFEITNNMLLNQIDEEAVHFPLCMRFQHETLRQTHHLKHFSRLQYGLFLKGIGVSLADSLKFWKSEFLQTMPENVFSKKYAYKIKHMYGAVGGKIDYYPFSCEKIIEQLVDVNQIHGCPYKHWDDGPLKEVLKSYGIGEAHITEILKLKSQEKYTEACARCFECTYSCRSDGPVTHPNLYYVNGCKLKGNLVDIEDIFDDSE